MKHYFCFTIVLILLFFAKITGAQENFATNIKKNASEEGKLLISYDIASPGEIKSFTVVLLLTYEGKQIEASAAYGDVGANVSPGSEKAIVWYYEDDFDGMIENVKVDVFAYKENEPRAIFRIASTSNKGYAPCEVVFANTSTYANEFQWNFGDPDSGPGNLSFEKNPVHVYKKGGIYSISLMARNTQSNLENVYYQSIEIKEYDPTVAGFEIEGNNQLAPAKVRFRNTSKNADTYQWNFGDPSFWRGNESDKKNPDHKYKDPGTYPVTLIVRNNFSGLSDTLVREVIVEQEKTAVPGFIHTKSSETAPSTVTFRNTSKEAVRYRWDFGDPSSGGKNSSEETDPVHLFASPGRYTVKLSAWAEGQNKPAEYSEEVVIDKLPDPPVARFIIENNQVLGPATIIFKNQSENAESYEWNFGDPDSGSENSSAKRDPSHTYKKAGTYKVTLTASSSEFINKSTVSHEVVILDASGPAATPVAKFIIENNQAPEPALIKFTSQSANASGYSWNFGDDTSDDNTSELENPVHIYSRAGKYKVTLTITGNKSGKTSEYSDFVVVTPREKDVPDPVAAFDAGPGQLVAPAKVRFSNISAGGDIYQWNFGDASSGDLNVSDQLNPEHIYEKAGKYRVTLTITNAESGKKGVAEKTLVVEKAAEPPVADFEISSSDAFVPVTVTFKNQSSHADAFKWNFGDFDAEVNESQSASPVHRYTIPGKYKVTLEAKNTQTGEVAEVTREINFRSRFKTFVGAEVSDGKHPAIYSAVFTRDDEYLVFAKAGERETEVWRMDGKGKVVDRKSLDYLVFTAIRDENNDEWLMVGAEDNDKLLIQPITRELKTGEPVVFQQRKSFKTDYFHPLLARSITDEVGVIANTVNDKYPLDIMFQKTDKSGRIIPLIDRTFKYVGTKLVTGMVPNSEGGFAITGYWQEDPGSPMLILFGKIDRKGHGEMHLISSEMNILGCDIQEAFHGGYAILRAKEGLENKDFYEMSFILIDSDGGPTECATMLPCTIKKEDILRYSPAMIKVKEGYVIASHGFNGVDYDISLFWIDQTGNVLKRYEDLRMAGDQFVSGLSQASDGCFLISGSQVVNGKERALIVKTDPYGKLNP